MYTIMYIKILVLIGTGLALMKRKLHKPSSINIYLCVCVYIYVYIHIYIPYYVQCVILQIWISFSFFTDIHVALRKKYLYIDSTIEWENSCNNKPMKRSGPQIASRMISWFGSEYLHMSSIPRNMHCWFIYIMDFGKPIINDGNFVTITGHTQVLGWQKW